MINVLFSAPDSRWAQFQTPLAQAFAEAGLKVDLSRDHVPGQVDYIVYAPNAGLSDFSPFTRARAVLNLWAGVEDVVGNPTLTLPLARMVDPSLAEGMVEWVAGHVLRHHLGMDAQIENPDSEWNPTSPPLARDRGVGILGLGALGAACARALAALNFRVSGWSGSQKDIDGVACHTGPDGLEAVLARSDILVLLLPLTAETENLMNADTLARLPRGAVVINPGRGALIDDAALLAAIDEGQVGHATLDTFRTEPLPREHPFWSDPRVTVTPHIASETRPNSAARVVAANIARAEAGQPLLHLVDRSAGY